MTPSKTTLVRIIDGDTVVTQSNRFLFFKAKPLRIRLYGIDAPESEQKGGDEATKALKRIASRHPPSIYLTKIATDHYGRTVGIIASGPDDVHSHYNFQMLELGQAHTYMLKGNSPFRAEYEAAERQAQKKRLGIWSDPHMERPAAFRRRQEAQQAKRGSLKTKLALTALAAAAAALAYYVFADDVSRFFSSLTAPFTG